MEQQSIQTSLQKKFQNELILFDETSDILTFTVKKQSIVAVVQFLKEVLGFQFLTDLGIHYPNRSYLALYTIFTIFSRNKNKGKNLYIGRKPGIDTPTTLFQRPTGWRGKHMILRN